jgi:hypothetical protein
VSVAQSDKVPSSVSSTLSSRSEIDSAKHVIMKALNLKKNVSAIKHIASQLTCVLGNEATILRHLEMSEIPLKRV